MLLLNYLGLEKLLYKTYFIRFFTYIFMRDIMLKKFYFKKLVTCILVILTFIDSLYGFLIGVLIVTWGNLAILIEIYGNF